MWVQRTPEELEKWKATSAKQARSQGFLLAMAVWVLVVLGLSTGWMIFGSSGVALPIQLPGGFWTKLLFAALIAAPFCYFVCRHEAKKELAKMAKGTICPGCDTAGEGNADVSCKCGDKFVLRSAMKWVE